MRKGEGRCNCSRCHSWVPVATPAKFFTACAGLGGKSVARKNGGCCKSTFWSHLGLARVAQGTKAIGTLLLKALECSFVQRGHLRAFVAPLKQ
jgi:hypothetical protein